MKKRKKQMKNSEKFKLIPFEDILDEHFGKIGTPKRDAFEMKVKLDVIGLAIKDARLKRNLTQEQLGKLVGVQKAQISKLESGVKDARLDTILKVFTALKAKISFNIE